MILTDLANTLFVQSLTAYTEKNYARCDDLVKQALAIDCTHLRALQLAGIVNVIHLGETQTGLELLERAHAATPYSAELNFNLAICHEFLGNLALTEQYLWRAIAEVDPTKRIPKAKENLAICLKAQNKIDACIAIYQSAQQDHPDQLGLLYEEAEMHLLNGNYPRGWAMYEQRWAYHSAGRPASVDHFWRLRDDLNGKTIRVFCDQGIGDTVMFMRYLPLLKARGAARLQFCARQTLMELVRNMGVVDDFLIEDPSPGAVQPELPVPDYQIATGSLATAFQTELHTIPYPGRYLQASSNRASYWQSRLSRFLGKKIGVVWSGNPAQKTDYRRSMAFSKFLTALPISKDLHFFNLQKYPRPSDMENLSNSQVIDGMPEVTDYADTAALMSQLDLVISTCTSSVHVAGALGIPVWVLLSYSADWRWLLNRTDSPWYNSAALIRQPAPNDWDSVLAEVYQKLVVFAQT